MTDSPYGRQRPDNQRARPSVRPRNSSTSRVFPMPGSPTTVTSWPVADSATRSNSCPRSWSSWWRPTNEGISATGRPELSPRTRHTCSGSAFPFTVAGGSASTSNRPVERAQRRLADHDAAVRRQRLHARRRVDHVAGDGFADLGPYAEAHHRYAGIHRDADGDARIGPAQLLHRLEDAHRGAHGAGRVVVVRDGRPEHAHDGVTDELVERSAEALDVLLDPPVEGQERSPDVLRVGLVGPLGEPHQVHEQDRDDAALFARGDLGDGRPRAPTGGATAVPHDGQNLADAGQRLAARVAPQGERLTALLAEARPGRILGAAGRTDVHPRSLGSGAAPVFARRRQGPRPNGRLVLVRRGTVPCLSTFTPRRTNHGQFPTTAAPTVAPRRGRPFDPAPAGLP